MTNPLRVMEEQDNEPIIIDEAKNSGLLNDGNSDTYSIEDSTWAFLELAFAVKKTHRQQDPQAWKTKYRLLKCDTIRCPKLDTIVEKVFKKDALHKD